MSKTFPLMSMLVLAAGSILTGCDAVDQATVSGKVTLDGRPLDHGVIVFVNPQEKNKAGISGQIHSDGTYIAQIGQTGEVVAGEYAVILDVRAPSITAEEGVPPMPGELLVPVRYTQIGTSDLRYHIRTGENIIDIALVSDEPQVIESESAEEGVVNGTNESGESLSTVTNNETDKSIEESHIEDRAPSTTEKNDTEAAIERTPQ